MEQPYKRFVVMAGSAAVAAAVLTIIITPPSAVAAMFSFVSIMLAVLALSYVVGSFRAPSGAVATTGGSRSGGPGSRTTAGTGGVDGGPADQGLSERQQADTAAARVDADEFRWLVREGIGVAIASMFGLLLLVLFLLEETAVVQGSETAVGEWTAWLVLAVLALVLLLVGLWSWRGREQ
ncbi:hypothetical protein C482_09437 [Natrialba chahannaoensis JCM 10990]|uniref:Uncharacterized protein n=1 Tax=Natrialba chahannaoensis JCM 10990 TaxID=1227492 RepID=M0AP26_9EURY|nr:hypothetical protein [Natrialba chahannaoensis]ELY99697.1 hypothetical protein C482_09437 [Natrialba chahannaoensis JCM 10990]